jgi:hypothetical protein
MRPYLTSAALCAALLTLASSTRVRADDDVPQPESRTVVQPPAAAAPAAQPATPPPPAIAPAAPRSEIGFTLRSGLAESDRFLFGGSFGGASGWLMAGVSTDAVLDVRGSGHHSERYHHDDHDGWSDYCHESNGRCLNRADLALSGYFGVRKKTGPVLGGARLRLELAGELGWQWSFVDERVSSTSSETVWSSGSRAFPIAGVRGQVGLTVFRNATFGLGAYARQGLAGRVCVNTDGGCTKVGGLTAGVYLFGGGDWLLSGR